MRAPNARGNVPMANAKIISLLDHELTTAREQIIHDINTNVLNLRVHKLREDVDKLAAERPPQGA
jgi:hypothetical protein